MRIFSPGFRVAEPPGADNWLLFGPDNGPPMPSPNGNLTAIGSPAFAVVGPPKPDLTVEAGRSFWYHSTLQFVPLMAGCSRRARVSSRDIVECRDGSTQTKTMQRTYRVSPRPRPPQTEESDGLPEMQPFGSHSRCLPELRHVHGPYCGSAARERIETLCRSMGLAFCGYARNN